MTKQEVLTLIEQIEKLYNNPFTRKRNITDKDKTDEEIIFDTVNTWHEFLKDDEADRVFENFKRHVTTNIFPPTIAELKTEPKPRNEYLERIKQMKKEVRNARLHQKH